MKLNQQQRLIMALEARGSTIVEHRRKYAILTRHNSRERYFIGNAGSLRVGFTYSASRPVADRFKADCLASVSATVPRVGTCRIVQPIDLDL